jgi:DNA-binding transcriptional ArsR family regulator
LLVQAGPEGVNAGAIGEKLGLAPATLSFHLAHLNRAGLIVARQEGRFIFYAADFAVMDGLIAYLTDNCCDGGTCAVKPRQSSVKAKLK